VKTREQGGEVITRTNRMCHHHSKNKYHAQPSCATTTQHSKASKDPPAPAEPATARAQCPVTCPQPNTATSQLTYDPTYQSAMTTVSPATPMSPWSPFNSHSTLPPIKSHSMSPSTSTTTHSQSSSSQTTTPGLTTQHHLTSNYHQRPTTTLNYTPP